MDSSHETLKDADDKRSHIDADNWFITALRVNLCLNPAASEYPYPSRWFGYWPPEPKLIDRKWISERPHDTKGDGPNPPSFQQIFLQAMHWSTSTIRRPWKSEHVLVQNSSMWLSFTFDTVLMFKAPGTPDPWVRSGWFIGTFALIHLGNEVRTILIEPNGSSCFIFANIDRPVSV